MCTKLFACALCLVAASVAAKCSAVSEQSDVCSEVSTTQAQALLQANRAVSTHSSKLLEDFPKSASGVNPSGAADPGIQCPFVIPDVSIPLPEVRQRSLSTQKISPRSKLKCECAYTFETFHKPPGARTNCSADARLPPCAVNQSSLMGQAVWNLMEPGYPVHPCFCGAETPPLDQLQSFAERCLKPDRGLDGSWPAFFLLGDSHSQMLANGLNMAVKGVMSFQFFSFGAGCGYLPPLYNDKWPKCADYNRYANDAIKEFARAGDVVGVGVADALGKHPSGFIEECPPGSNCRYGSVFADAKAYFIELHEVLQAKGASLLLFGDLANLINLHGRCQPTLQGSMPLKECQTPRADAVSSSSPSKDKLFKELARKLPGVFYFDYYDLFCDDDGCGPNIPGTDIITYFTPRGQKSGGGAHIEQRGAFYLWPFLCDFLNKNSVIPEATNSEAQKSETQQF